MSVKYNQKLSNSIDNKKAKLTSYKNFSTVANGFDNQKNEKRLSNKSVSQNILTKHFRDSFDENSNKENNITIKSKQLNYSLSLVTPQKANKIYLIDLTNKAPSSISNRKNNKGDNFNQTFTISPIKTEPVKEENKTRNKSRKSNSKGKGNENTTKKYEMKTNFDEILEKVNKNLKAKVPSNHKKTQSLLSYNSSNNKLKVHNENSPLINKSKMIIEESNTDKKIKQSCSKKLYESFSNKSSNSVTSSFRNYINELFNSNKNNIELIKEFVEIFHLEYKNIFKQNIKFQTNSNFKNLEKENEELKNELKDLNLKLKNNEKKCDKLNEEKSKLSSEIVSIKSVLQGFQSQISDISKHSPNLKIELEPNKTKSKSFIYKNQSKENMLENLKINIKKNVNLESKPKELSKPNVPIGNNKTGKINDQSSSAKTTSNTKNNKLSNKTLNENLENERSQICRIQEDYSMLSASSDYSNDKDAGLSFKNKEGVGENQRKKSENLKKIPISLNLHKEGNEEKTKINAFSINLNNLPKEDYNNEFMSNYNDFSPSWRKEVKNMKCVDEKQYNDQSKNDQ